MATTVCYKENTTLHNLQFGLIESGAEDMYKGCKKCQPTQAGIQTTTPYDVCAQSSCQSSTRRPQARGGSRDTGRQLSVARRVPEVCCSSCRQHVEGSRDGTSLPAYVHWDTRTTEQISLLQRWMYHPVCDGASAATLNNIPSDMRSKVRYTVVMSCATSAHTAGAPRVSVGRSSLCA